MKIGGIYQEEGSTNFVVLFYITFQTHDRKEPQHLGDGISLPKLLIACQSPHFVKISEIKSISKPLMIMGRNLQPLTEYVNRRVQEEVNKQPFL
jgi:hypothetical protein